MPEYKITKQLIKRFQDAIPEVKIVNGLEDDSLTAGMNLVIPYYSSDFK